MRARFRCALLISSSGASGDTPRSSAASTAGSPRAAPDVGGVGGEEEAAIWAADAAARRQRGAVEEATKRLYAERIEVTKARGKMNHAEMEETRETEGMRLAEEISEERLWRGIATLRASSEQRARRRHTLERKSRLDAKEKVELKVLVRNEACLEALLRFEAEAEAADEPGRLRLWQEYRRGSAAGDGRGRHYVMHGGYFSKVEREESDENGGGGGGGGGGGVAGARANESDVTCEIERRGGARSSWRFQVSDGNVVTSVDEDIVVYAGGDAAGSLRVGDRVVALDGQPLQGRLWASVADGASRLRLRLRRPERVARREAAARRLMRGGGGVAERAVD